MPIRNQKIGRNEPCPCGARKADGTPIKFKKCHGASVPPAFSVSEEPISEVIRKKMEEHKAMELQREQQQGLGKPIISETFKGYRLVAVGGKLFYSKQWKTFHDFLADYIKTVLGGGAWGNAELKKPQSERHPILVWYEVGTRHMNELMKEPGKVHIAPMTGAVAAYFRLAYNLYLLGHNVKLQEILVRRLKDKDQFYGAHYETFVAGVLIRAGFDIEFEDETDGSTTHCEFTATFRKTGEKFSVEAKVRGRNKASVDVGNQLYSALRKVAKHTRIVFIEVNVPPTSDGESTLSTLRQVVNSLRTREEKLTIDKQPAPPAYVIVTNNPHDYDLHGEVKTWAAGEGYKIPDFKMDSRFSSLREALNTREKHIEIFDLMKSLAEHQEIPSTFDGDSPDLAFANGPERLKVGERYAIPDGNGGEVIGELVDAVVMEQRKMAFGFYKLSDGKHVGFECPLTDDEIAAYQRHPETFFGVVKKGTKNTNDPIEFYDHCFEIYKNSPKEVLLNLMTGAANYEELAKSSQRELAEKYSEHVVYSVLEMARQRDALKAREGAPPLEANPISSRSAQS
jgi:hypothetical protein